MASFLLRCTVCDARFEEDPDLLLCPSCSTHSVSSHLSGVLEIEITTPPETLPPPPGNDLETTRTFLPVTTECPFSPLSPGGTPLLELPSLRTALGMPKLFVKDDTRNPSGSTKDRASYLVAAKAFEYRRNTIATASTGNAATALAAICASTGQRAVVFVPASAPKAKLTQMQSYGARIFAVEGTYDQAFDLCNEACRRFGWYNRNTAMNPFTTEGKKTAALEIAAQLHGDTPETIIIPAGDGVITAGIAKGFVELFEWGLITRIPRILIVQPEGSDALVRALIDGTEDVIPRIGASSVADSLVVETPRNSRWALQLIRESNGTGLSVSDDEILRAIPELASLTGVFAEPAAAASFAGLKKALKSQLLDPAAPCVLMVTGTGLKDPSAARRALPDIPEIAPDIDALSTLVF